MGERHIRIAIAVSLAAVLAIILIAPNYDIDPTTLRDNSVPQTLASAALLQLSPATLLTIAAAPELLSLPTPCSDLVAVTCTRLC